MSAPLIELHGLSRRYVVGDQELYALRDIDLEIRAGEMVALMGASGSGKSTLLNILGCLDRPSSGVYRVDGRETTSLDATELAALRRDRFGFIFQRYNLLPQLTARANVEIPAIYAGVAGGGPPHARAKTARAAWPWRAPRPPSQSAFGRPAAARQHRARLDERRRDHSGRRADGSARQPHRPRDDGASARFEPARPHTDHRDA